MALKSKQSEVVPRTSNIHKLRQAFLCDIFHKTVRTLSVKVQQISCKYLPSTFVWHPNTQEHILILYLFKYIASLT